VSIERTTLSDLERDGELAGYRPYSPRGLGAGIDEFVAERSPCDACGHVGCRFAGFHDDGDSYLAYAVCRRCSHAMSF
jgi:hypothetical protein